MLCYASVLASALVGGEWQASRSCRRKEAPSIHWLGSWVLPIFSLDVVKKIKMLHCTKSNSSPAALNPSLYRLSYTDST
jgi:hypothetical protein